MSQQTLIRSNILFSLFPILYTYIKISHSIFSLFYVWACTIGYLYNYVLILISYDSNAKLESMVTSKLNHIYHPTNFGSEH